MTKNVLGELERRLATGPLRHDAPDKIFCRAGRAARPQSSLPFAFEIGHDILVGMANCMTIGERLKILQDAADDRSYKETAAELHATEGAIKQRAWSLFRKLSVRSKSGAVAVALRRGLID